jgi:predicted RNA binding protein YcfA (HicA-like mRNA interferase family)
MDSRQLLRLLKEDGWVHVRTTGQHWHFKHPTKKGLVTVPHPKKDLPKGTVHRIFRQAQLKAR